MKNLADRMFFGRRAFFAGAGAAATTLLKPWSVFGADAKQPKRLLVVFTPGGFNDNRWQSTMSGETNYTLGTMLKPLEPVRNDVLIMSGINADSWLRPHKDSCCMLTGTQSQNTNDPESHIGSSISLDQQMAKELNVGTKIKYPLYLAVTRVDSGAPTSTNLSYTGARQPVAPAVFPWEAFKTVFGDYKPGVAAGAPDLAVDRKVRVLDLALSQLNKIRARVNGEELCRLDKFMSSLEDTEASAKKTVGATLCDVPTEASLKTPRIPDLSDANIRLVTSALQCDVTRVGMLQWGKTGGGTGDLTLNFPGPNANEPHHEIGHKRDGGSLATLDRIHAWYNSQFAKIILGLKAAGIFDHTVVYWITDLSDAPGHRSLDMPSMLAGGGIKGGRYLKRNNESLVKVLTAVSYKLGVEKNFGSPSFGLGPAAGIL